MSDRSFGGAGGAVVKGYLSPGTLVTTVPVLVSVILLGFLAGWICNLLLLRGALSFVVMLIVVSPIMGRFALAAKRGDIDSGFMMSGIRSELSAFVVRFAVATLIWGIPAALLSDYLLKASLGMASLTPSLNMGSLLGLVLTFIFLLGPVISLLVATATDSLAEVLDLSVIRWIMGERRGDLGVFFAYAFGAVFLFYLLSLPFLIPLGVMLFKISPKLGITVGTSIMFLPMASAPVLVGRLAGVFVRSDSSSDSLGHEHRLAQFVAVAAPRHAQPAATDAAAADQAPAGSAKPALAAKLPGNHPSDAEMLRSFVKEAKGIEEHQVPELEQAIVRAESLRRKHPTNLQLLAVHAQLNGKLGRIDKALALTSLAIPQAFKAGSNPLVNELFGSVRAYRDRLGLSADDFLLLGRVLVANQQFLDAAWAFAQCANNGGDELAAQKGVISSGDGALTAGQHQQATQIYQAFLKRFPASSFASYCEEKLRSSVR